MSKKVFIVIVFLYVLQYPAELRSLDRTKALDYEYEDNDEFTMFVSGGYRPESSSTIKHMVSIRTIRPTAYFGDNHYCAGVIIAARAVVTAAHCVVDSRGIKTRPRRINIVAGTPMRLKRTKTTVEVGVDEVIPHEKYVRRVKNDIAILRLKTPLPDNNDFIRIAVLARQSITEYRSCFVIGWGQLFHNGPYSNYGIGAELMVFRGLRCKRAYPHIFTEGMICAGNRTDWEKSACRGDSGSPLMCEGFLFGIVSWSDTCGKEDFPSVFTDIAYHRDWILEVSGMAGLELTSAVKLSFIFMMGKVVQKFCITV